MPKIPDVNAISAYENGELSARDTLELFADLIKTGMAWQLQGSIYGRPAMRMINQGYITRDGQITAAGLEATEPNPLASDSDEPEASIE
jgi:hypothetical protein